MVKRPSLQFWQCPKETRLSISVRYQTHATPGQIEGADGKARGLGAFGDKHFRVEGAASLYGHTMIFANTIEFTFVIYLVDTAPVFVIGGRYKYLSARAHKCANQGRGYNWMNGATVINLWGSY